MKEKAQASGTRKKSRSGRKSPSPPRESEVCAIRIVTSAFFGSAVGAAAALILLIVSAFVCYSSNGVHTLGTPLALAALYVSSAVAGFAAVKKNRSRALLCGSLSGAILMLIFLVISLLFKAEAEPVFAMPLSLLLRMLMIVFAAIGGYIAISTSNKKVKKRHR